MPFLPFPPFASNFTFSIPFPFPISPSTSYFPLSPFSLPFHHLLLETTSTTTTHSLGKIDSVLFDIFVTPSHSLLCPPKSSFSLHFATTHQRSLSLLEAQLDYSTVCGHSMLALCDSFVRSVPFLLYPCFFFSPFPRSKARRHRHRRTHGHKDTQITDTFTDGTWTHRVVENRIIQEASTNKTTRRSKKDKAKAVGLSLINNSHHFETDLFHRNIHHHVSCSTVLDLDLSNSLQLFTLYAHHTSLIAIGPFGVPSSFLCYLVPFFHPLCNLDMHVYFNIPLGHSMLSTFTLQRC